MISTPSEASARREIGALVPDPRRAGSVRLLVEGRPLLTISREVVERERLAPGVRLEEALYARLCRAADEEAAFRTAMRHLEQRSYAARDLARRLVFKGHPPAAAEAAVERARQMELVDDPRFCRNYAETRGARGRGPLRIRRDLASMGVERGIIDVALAQAFGADGNGGPQPDRLAARRLTQLRGLPRPVQRRRLLAFLARRGFAGAAVSRMVGQLLGQEASPGSG